MKLIDPFEMLHITAVTKFLAHRLSEHHIVGYRVDANYIHLSWEIENGLLEHEQHYIWVYQEGLKLALRLGVSERNMAFQAGINAGFDRNNRLNPGRFA